MTAKPKPLQGLVLFNILTKGIYTTFTRALKEAVSNAYDAGANSIRIDFDPPDFITNESPKDLTIQIRDDGSGMSLEGFWAEFASIESTKSPTALNAKTRRYPVGKFGIGAFALTPFVNKITIYSKRYRKPPIRCEIDAHNLVGRNPKIRSEHDYVDHVCENIIAQEVEPELWDTVSGSSDSGTVICLEGVPEETYYELDRGTELLDVSERGIYNDAPFTQGLREIAWELSTLLPLKYSEVHYSQIQEYTDYLQSNNPGVKIELSDVLLERHLHIQPNASFKPFEYDEDGIRAKGLMIANPSPVTPRKANGILLRLNNVGIGEHTLFGLGGQKQILQRLTGEIHIHSGLHENLNAARDRFSGQPFERLRQNILVRLNELKEGASKRQTQKVSTQDSAARKQIEKRFAQIARGENDNEPQSRTASTKGANNSPAPNRKARGKSAEPTKEIDASTIKRFADPVQDVKVRTGEMILDESHPLFRAYKNKSEQKMIDLMLRALKLADVSDDVYESVIRNMIALKV